MGAGLAAVPGVQAAGAGSAPQASGHSLVQKMKDGAEGAVALSREAATGKVGFVRVAKGGDLLPTYRGNAAAKADAFLTRYAGLFGAERSELVKSGSQGGKYGTTVTYTQRYQGVPVYGSEIRVNLDSQGDLTSANGYAAPDLDLSVTPALSKAAAGRAAVGTVRQQPPGSNGKADTTGIKAVNTQLSIYRMGSTRGETGASRLVWVVEVSNDHNIRDMVFLDAQTGKVVNRVSMVEDALTRHLYEAGGTAQAPTFTNVWNEGEPFPGALNQDQQNEVTGTGDAYWFFKNTFGRDSYDGAGHAMTTVNNDPRISCPNANWNGTTTNYCSGLASDDVVAHEWGHAYTEYTHGLIYQWQSGALNESYSDIWGETVDLINGRLDEGEGDITTPRPVGVCSTHSPLPTIVTINSPATIAKTCEAGPAAFGPTLSSTGITGDVAQGLTAAGATTGCDPIVTDLTGKVGLVDRGTCAFTIKVKNAQNAGATSVLVGDNVEATPSGMSGSDATITIPSVRIRLSDRNLIVGELAKGPVNVTMKQDASNRFDSTRWLMGESTTAFGGAIRDMWSPTCYGDPGKVSDAQYYCATDDGGGVHSNSGVPNHGYALLVDGGTFNGVTVNGIGLDKAANIYFRAMTAYQTPTTDFTDHADSLESSCSDLIGKPITKLSTQPDAAPAAADLITAADCASVAAMTQAVEFRKEPTQCNFQPMLDPNAPSLCGAGSKQNVVWKDGFDTGLANWTADQEVVYPGGNGYPWKATTVTGHTGQVAFAPDPRGGNCSSGAGDISSRDSIVSPVVEMPGAGMKSPRLTFDHSMASEAGYDGGNVKVKVNGAGWNLIPASAYVFNPPRTTMASSATNTSPLAGEVGFSGTDGGKLESIWGQSQIDLGKLGVTPGSTVQLRFDFGRDGCGGVTGWAVDNVTVSTCKPKVKGSTASATQAVKGRKTAR
jgi:Zn-dependent metalloprotease